LLFWELSKKIKIFIFLNIFEKGINNSLKNYINISKRENLLNSSHLNIIMPKFLNLNKNLVKNNIIYFLYIKAQFYKLEISKVSIVISQE